MAEIASAFVSIIPSAKGFGSKLNSEVGGGVRSSASSLGKTFGKLFVLGAGVIAAAGIGGFLKGSISEAREAQQVGAQTAAVLKSTGGAANISAGQIGKLATALSNKIGVDDEAIQAGENLLLTFTNVRNEAGKGNDIFTQATRTVQDMAAAFGGDATSNSKILGKALNDPVKGISALTRVGVQFTDGQKDQIKTMVESGNVVGAQKIILGELSKQAKGSAEAQATAGKKAKVAWDNLKETIGTALLPVLDKLENYFTGKIVPAISTFVGQLQSGAGVGGQVAGVFSAIGGAIGTFIGQIKSGTGPGGLLASILGTVASAVGTLFTFINNNRTVVAVFVGTIYAIVAATAAWNAVLAINPIGLVVLAIAALAAGLVYAYKHSEKFKAVVDATFGFIKEYVPPIISFIVNFVKDHWQLLLGIIGGPLGIIVGLVIKHFGTIKSIVGTVATFVVDSAKKYAQFAKAVIDKVGDVVAFFKDLPGKIKGFLTSLPGELKTIGGQIIMGLVHGIQAAAGKVASAVKAIVDKIPSKIRSIMGIASPSKVTAELGRFIGDGLADGIASKTGKVSDATQKLVDATKAKLDDLKQQFSSIKDSVASAFTGDLFSATNAADFLTNLTSTHGTLAALSSAFRKLVKEGVAPSFLSALFQSGNAPLILDLASGSRSQALAAASEFGAITNLSDKLGGQVAQADLGKKIDKTNDQLAAILKATKRTGEDVARALNNVSSNAGRRARAA